MPKDDPMDEAEVHRLLSRALQLQCRSALLHAVAAGSVGGTAGLMATDLLADFAALETADVQRLTDKLVALGGTIPTETLGLPALGTDFDEVIEALADAEDETIAALHQVIEPSGQEPRSEALEHLMEHVITRKQAQVDRLRRALR
jgi:bacterioferritin (cytochrome b1)